MTIEEAKELAEKLKIEIIAKREAEEKLRQEEKSLEARLEEIQNKLRASWKDRAAEEEYKVVHHVLNGLCKNGISRSTWGDKRWESWKLCEKKAKPGEELCGIHLNVKKRDEENRKRWSGNA